MKTSALFTLVLAPLAMAADKPAKCNADNCARVVTGTNVKPALTARQSDCSKYMTTTVTPAAVTVTSTVQATITPAPNRRGLVEARDGDEPTIPAYAATCATGGTSRYSSACACWGITAAVVTAPTPTTTVTVTATAAAGCPGEPGTCANGYLGGRGFFPCDGGQCSCSPGDGRNVCYHHGSCGPECATDNDCAADGLVCVFETCCGRGACLVPADVCVNPVAARQVFRAARRAPAVPRDLAEDECTSLSCPSRQEQ